MRRFTRLLGGRRVIAPKGRRIGNAFIKKPFGIVARSGNSPAVQVNSLSYLHPSGNFVHSKKPARNSVVDGIGAAKFLFDTR